MVQQCISLWNQVESILRERYEIFYQAIICVSSQEMAKPRKVDLLREALINKMGKIILRFELKNCLRDLDRCL